MPADRRRCSFACSPKLTEKDKESLFCSILVPSAYLHSRTQFFMFYIVPGHCLIKKNMTYTYILQRNRPELYMLQSVLEFVFSEFLRTLVERRNTILRISVVSVAFPASDEERRPEQYLSSSPS